MAIEAGARLPPFEALRVELQTMRRSPMVVLSGKGPALDMLDAYLVAIEARLSALEAKVHGKG